MSIPLLVTHRVCDTKVAIVFLHGFSGDPAKTWGQFPAFLATDPRLVEWDIFSIGYTTRLVPDIVGIWNADAPLERLAGLLISTAGVSPLGNYRSIAFVAHSMGGLILQRALLDRGELADRTSQVTLFGTPSAGLSKAGPFRFLKRQVRDMADTSAFISSLRSNWKTKFESNAPFKFVTVAGDQDEFVPSTSSLDPFPASQREVVPGNHLAIVKPADAMNLSVQIILRSVLGDATGPRSAAALAIESRNFVETLRLLQDHRADLDEQGVVQLALALEGLGRQGEAISLLEAYGGGETDPMGVLAGRLKRRWLAGHRRADANRALDLYRKGYQLSAAKGNHAQAYYHGINVAFMELAYGSDCEAARAIAVDVLQHCALAPRKLWCEATKGEANLVLGESLAALRHYRNALSLGPTPREVSSMFQQAFRMADLVGDDDCATELAELYRGDEGSGE
jgi:pimeloyl-ACP methyl ester carboxylesterase